MRLEMKTPHYASFFTLTQAEFQATTPHIHIRLFYSSQKPRRHRVPSRIHVREAAQQQLGPNTEAVEEPRGPVEQAPSRRSRQGRVLVGCASIVRSSYAYEDVDAASQAWKMLPYPQMPMNLDLPHSPPLPGTFAAMQLAILKIWR